MEETYKKVKDINVEIMKLFELVSQVKPEQKSYELLVNFYLNFAIFASYFSDIKCQRTKKAAVEDSRNLIENIKQQIIIIAELGKKISNFGSREMKTIAEKIEKFDVLKFGGDPDFFEQHKSQLKKWAEKPPTKEKMLRALSLWTGVEGEDAILSTLQSLRNSAKKMILHVSRVYGLRENFNESLHNFYYTTLNEFIAYYVKHREKYIGGSHITQKIFFDKISQISLNDDFIKLNITIKKCNFSQFKPLIVKIIKALNNVDLAAVKKMAAELIGRENAVISLPDESADIFARKNIKREIIKAVEICAEQLECLEIKKMHIKIYGEVSVEALLKSAGEFVRAEEECAANSKEIKSLFDEQAENINLVNQKIGELIGPSVRPCVKRIFQFIAPALFAENAEEWMEFFQFKWTRLIHSKKLTSEFDALVNHVLNW